MKAWLLGLGLALFCTVHANFTAMEEIQHERLSGTWHVLGLASNCPEFQRFSSRLRSSPATISQTEDGNVRIVTYISTKKGCKKIDITFIRREDGKLVHKCEMGDKVLDSMATDYETYGIVKVHKTNDDHTCTILSLYAKERVLVPEKAEKFRRLASEVGIPESQVTFLPIEGKCEETK